MKGFASDLSRRQLLYRLHGPAAQSRLLIVGDEGAWLAEGWHGTVARCASSLYDLPTVEQFDVIALPGVLLPHSPGTASGIPCQQLLGRLSASVAAGGTVVGHMAHGIALKNLWQWQHLLRAATSLFDGATPLHPERLRKLLISAGLVEPECYFVQPNIESPMALVPCDRVAATAHFRQTVRSSRAGHSLASYVGRLALIEAGMGALLRDSLFFLARKPPC